MTDNNPRKSDQISRSRKGRAYPAWFCCGIRCRCGVAPDRRAGECGPPTLRTRSESDLSAPAPAISGFLGRATGISSTSAGKRSSKGLEIGGKTYKVDLLDRDSQSDPARAAQLAKSLIGESKIDFMLVTSTPEVVNPVADACEAAGVPCLSTVMPWEAWYFGRGGKPGQPSPFKWTFHFSFGGAQFAASYISAWNQIPTNKKVGAMFPNDADGNAVRGFLPDALRQAGFTVVDPGPFEDGTTDYSTQITTLQERAV